MEKLIDQLYAEFAKYPFPLDLRQNSCPCCISDEYIQTLLSKPLKRLSFDDLERYYFKAMSTCGTVDHFKYFLPRVLELLASPANPFLWEFTGYDKLTYAKYETWPEAEQDLINRYFKALVDQLFAETTEEYVLSDAIDLSFSYLGVSETVQRGLNQSTVLQNFVQFITWNDKRYTDGLYAIRDEQLQTQLLQQLEALYYLTDDEIDAELTSVAYTSLEAEYRK